ncbi:MAG: helix-turn-helix domain-containing protein [Cyanobacteria bacterium J06607_10]
MTHSWIILALSPQQKQRIFDMLAAGQTAAQAADVVGCSRATVQRLKRKTKSDPLLKVAQGLSATRQLTSQGDQVVQTLNTLSEHEPQIQQGLRDMFDGLCELFSQVLEQTDPADVSPRQLPALAKSAAQVAIAYADFADRVNGLEVLADEVQKLNETRAA